MSNEGCTENVSHRPYFNCFYTDINDKIMKYINKDFDFWLLLPVTVKIMNNINQQDLILRY